MKNTGVRKVLFAFLWLTAAIQVFADETFSENGFTYTIIKDNGSLSLVSYQATAAHEYKNRYFSRISFTSCLIIPKTITLPSSKQETVKNSITETSWTEQNYTSRPCNSM